MAGINYADFLDESYEPADSDLVCRFSVQPGEGLDMAAVAGRVANGRGKRAFLLASPTADHAGDAPSGA